MRRTRWTGTAVLIALAACRQSPAAADGNQNAPAAAASASAATTDFTAPATGTTSLVRLACGTIKVDDFSKRFSDRQLYPHGPKQLTDSCYLITHNGHRLLWDTGLPLALLNTPHAYGGMTAVLDVALVKQLAAIGVQPGQIEMVGISHSHFDHTGQAVAFPAATLLIGPQDFDQVKGKDDPFGHWRANGGKITPMPGDHDMFGDGDVVALFLPGHTDGHHALLVKLKSGTVLLSGDLYHATEARTQRGVPPFNSDRAQTLTSMDRFERIAKETGAKVIIQHEPADIAKLPAFPQAAE